MTTTRFIFTMFVQTVEQLLKENEKPKQKFTFRPKVSNEKVSNEKTQDILNDMKLSRLYPDYDQFLVEFIKHRKFLREGK